MPGKQTKKPTIYLDTNVISILCYRGTNITAIHRHMVTKQWWETERQAFELFASALTESELRAGVYPGQKEAIKLVRRLRYLPFNSQVRRSAEDLLAKRIIPENKPGDASQLAFATIHKMDYLLTWNYAHLANVDTQSRLAALGQSRNWRVPLLVSPDNIPRVALGQTIRRRDDG